MQKHKKDLTYDNVGEYFEDDLGSLIDNYIMATPNYNYVNENGELFFEDNDRMDRYYETALANLVYLLKKTYNSPKLLCKKTNTIIDNPNYVEEKEREVFEKFGQGYIYRISN